MKGRRLVLGILGPAPPTPESAPTTSTTFPMTTRYCAFNSFTFFFILAHFLLGSTLFLYSEAVFLYHSMFLSFFYLLYFPLSPHILLPPPPLVEKPLILATAILTPVIIILTSVRHPNKSYFSP